MFTLARTLGFAAVAAGALSVTLPSLARAADAPPQEAAKVWPYLASLPADQRKAVIEQEAAKEDGIVIYGATGLDRGQFWVGEFNKLYPNLNVEFVRVTETDLVQKVTAEHRAGKSQSDVVIETATYLPLIQQVLAPYVAGPDADIDKRFKYGSAAEGWIAYVYEVFPESIAWRTDTVSEAEVPKTLHELASGKFDKRMGTTPNIARLATGLVETEGEAGAQALLEALAKKNSKIYSSHSALSDALASGEVDFAWDLVASRPISLKAKGAPVEWKLMDPLFGESNTIAIVNNTDSPYTAALFIDTIMSKEVLEASDQWQAGRFFGNTKGTFDMSLDDYPNLTLFPVVDTDVIGKWQDVGERLFIRRQ